MAKLFANSGNPDQMPHFAASDLGLLCLPITLLRVSRLKWVNSLLYLFKNLGKCILLPVYASKKLLDERQTV